MKWQNLPSALPQRRRFVTWLSAVWVIALLACLASLRVSASGFVTAYLSAFLFTVTTGWGALFFVILHHLVGARWSRHACDYMEVVTGLLYLAPALFVPLVIGYKYAFPWMNGIDAEAATLTGKSLYLSPAFFFARAAVYLVIWSVLAALFRHGRASADPEVAPRRQRRLARSSGPAMAVFGVTCIFAAFDWVMSLQGAFHSAVIGVYVFAGAVPAGLSLLIIAITMGQSGEVRASATATSERHDLGKLLFGFSVFWAYLAFSQYLLIWYANLPHEVDFYTRRWTPETRPWTIVLIMARFTVPFIVLLSRETKRSAKDLFAVSTIALFGHAVDCGWLVMPTLASPLSSTWLSAAGPWLLAAVSVVTAIRHAGQLQPDVGTVNVSMNELLLPALTGTADTLSFNDAKGFANVRALRSHAATLGTGQVRPAASSLPQPKSAISTFWFCASAGMVTLVGSVFAASAFIHELQKETFRKAEAEQIAMAAGRPESPAPRLEYQWLDRTAGILRIPVARASELIEADDASKRCRETASQPTRSAP